MGDRWNAHILEVPFSGLFDQKVGLGFLATFLHWLIGTKDVLVTKKSVENLFDEKEEEKSSPVQKRNSIILVPCTFLQRL